MPTKLPDQATCPYCHPQPNKLSDHQPQMALQDLNDQAVWVDSTHHKLWIAHYNETSVDINFCPKCGRKLN